jgi:hypothetical protein
MLSVLRLINALKAYKDKANNNSKPFEHDRLKWSEIQEFEAVLNSVANLTTFAQFHKLELAAYRTIALRALLYCFVTRQHFVVDIDNLKARGAVPRIRRVLRTSVGIEANSRGLIELLYRFGYGGVRLTAAPFVDIDDVDADARIEAILRKIVTTNDEQIAHALDFRTCWGSPLFGPGDKYAQRAVANGMVDKLEVAYIKHARRAAEFSREKAAAAAAHAGANVGVGRGYRGGDASIFAADDDDDDDDDDDAMAIVAPLTVETDNELKAKFRHFYKKWAAKASTLDWEAEFKDEYLKHTPAALARTELITELDRWRVNEGGEETDGEEEEDEDDDRDDDGHDDDDEEGGGRMELFPEAINVDQEFIFPKCTLPVSAKVYNKLTEGEFGFLPAIARCYSGSPSSEAFCERIISFMNLVMNDRSTKLHPKLMEKRVLLLVNRDYMDRKKEERRERAVAERFTKKVKTRKKGDEEVE